jgi:hypothetical protein
MLGGRREERVLANKGISQKEDYISCLHLLYSEQK